MERKTELHLQIGETTVRVFANSDGKTLVSVIEPGKPAETHTLQRSK